ncbi:MAG: efflux RND transporter permease subunit [Sporomusaceae bacterium]|nr:efflux RND transporter permease subunit [Sporomusaceae bacterium]
MILTEISLRRPVLATVTILALVILGLVSYMSLNIDEWPDVEFPYVTVQVPYKGAAPEQVDSKIVQKVEEAVSSISGVKHIYSTAREGVGITTVEFTLETSANIAAQDVRDKIGRIRGELPADSDEPVIMRFDPSESPIVSAALTSEKLSVREMTTLVDDVIKRRLETINGVGAINVRGSQKRQINIDLERDKMTAYGLTIPEIIDNLRGENMEVPGGKLTKGEHEVAIRTMGNLVAAAEFLTVPVGRRDTIQLYVNHIGTVTDGAEESVSMAKLNGSTAVGIDIMKQSGTNTVQVVDDIKKTLVNIRKDLPPGVELILVRDNSVKIRESVNDVLFNLVFGGLLAVLIVFIFLGNWRSTLISAIAIPASIISTFFLMKMLGYTLNTMSLMALSLAVGILIDDAIVVIENIVRHMEMGKDKFRAAAEATEEIGLAVTATTLTLVAVFLPVAMMTGIVGQFFKQFGITVAFAVLVSLFIAFTLTPMLAANHLEIAHGQKQNWLGRALTWVNMHFDRLTEKYSVLLGKILHHRLKTIGLALCLFFGSLALVPLLGSNFLTPSDDGELQIMADIDAGLSVAGAGAVADAMTSIIRAVPESVIVYSTAEPNSLNFFVKLTNKNQRERSSNTVATELRSRFSSMPGIKVSIIQNSGFKPEKPVALVMTGESLDTLENIAAQAQRIMENIKGGADVTSSYKPGKPDAQIVIQRERAADLGVSTASIADTLRTLFNGTVVSQFKDGDDRYDVRARLRAEDRMGIDDVKGIYVPSRYKDVMGKTVLVPLEQVTNTLYSTSPSEILRYDRQKNIKLTANLAGTSLGEFNKTLFKELQVIDVPSGYSFVTTGESERMGDTFTSMMMALFLGVSFIFFILAGQFESYIDPFAIMLSLPLAIIGAILGLLVMGSDMSLMSMIGIIMLMGLVTKNAILLVDFAKQRITEGLSRDEALVKAARVRMRPIMMTTAAMIFGMLPLAIGFGPGAEGRAPMAHAIIGGLIVSTMLTLIVVPVVYSLLDEIKGKFNKRKQFNRGVKIES